MLKAGRDLRAAIYPKMFHVSCLAHALHNVCHLARRQYKNVDRLVVNFKRIFAKCPRRRNEIRNVFDVPLPKLPVDTRWGTWIEFCRFLYIHYDEIESYVATIDDEVNLGIDDLLELMADRETRNQLTALHDISFLPASITRLEKQGMTIDEQKSIIDDALARLKDPFKAKLLSLLSNNPSYSDIFKLTSMHDMRIFRFAPLASVDVERSFSSIKLIDSDRRQSFTAEHLKQYAIAYFNRSDRISCTQPE
jgi:hypothetical protein